jgi:hypothetical protein
VRLTPKDQAQDKPDSERREYRLCRVFAHVLLRIFLDCPDAILRIVPRLLGPAARYPPTIAPAADFKSSGRLTGARSAAFQFRPSLFCFILFRGHCYIPGDFNSFLSKNGIRELIALIQYGGCYGSLNSPALGKRRRTVRLDVLKELGE